MEEEEEKNDHNKYRKKMRAIYLYSAANIFSFQTYFWNRKREEEKEENESQDHFQMQVRVKMIVTTLFL